MQIASRQTVWGGAGRGTVIEVEMTPDTGLHIGFIYDLAAGHDVTIDWGDGTKTGRAYTAHLVEDGHTYAAYGRYRIVFDGVKDVNFRIYDGVEQYPYDDAIISFVDHSGLVDNARSGAFQESGNLERFIAPNCRDFGQRAFSYCPRLKEVVAPLGEFFYDGTFQGCRELETLELVGGTMWSYVFAGCTKLREIRFSRVDQISTRCFGECPALADVWIANKTIAQTMQTAPSGNIIGGYGESFPWGANASTQFHCRDGIVLGNGTIING